MATWIFMNVAIRRKSISNICRDLFDWALHKNTASVKTSSYYYTMYTAAVVIELSSVLASSIPRLFPTHWLRRRRSSSGRRGLVSAVCTVLLYVLLFQRVFFRLERAVGLWPYTWSEVEIIVLVTIGVYCQCAVSICSRLQILIWSV